MLSDRKDSVIYDRRERIIANENYILITPLALTLSQSFPLDPVLSKGDIKSKVGRVSGVAVRRESPLAAREGR